jgi:hypothetical protein
MSPLIKANGIPVHFWCEACEGTSSVTYFDSRIPDITGRYVGGDVICDQCHQIIATYGFPIVDGDESIFTPLHSTHRKAGPSHSFKSA